MSTIVSLEKAVDVNAEDGGLSLVLSHCRIPLGRYRKAGGKEGVETIDVYKQYTNGQIALPLGFAVKYCGLATGKLPMRDMSGAKRHPRNKDQEDILSKMRVSLEQTRTAMLECDPGMGKTFLSLYMGLAIGLNIAVILPKSSYVTQWREELLNIYPGFESRICAFDSVASGKASVPTPEAANFLFIRADLINRLTQEALIRYRYIVIDETHEMSKKMIENAVMFCNAAYTVGCSATPDKGDGRENAIALFVGRNNIVRHDNRAVNFMEIDINAKCDETEYQMMLRKSSKEVTGKAHLWLYGRMEISLAANYIVNARIALMAYVLAKKHNKKILIISTYIYQCNALCKILKEWNISADIYTGGHSKYDGYAQVLVAQRFKGMTAFDQATSGIPYDRRFNTAIMCQSLAQDGNMWQSIGRIKRAPAGEEILFVWAKYPMLAYEKQGKNIHEYLESKKVVTHVDRQGVISDAVYDNYYGQLEYVDLLETNDESKTVFSPLRIPEEPLDVLQ